LIKNEKYVCILKKYVIIISIFAFCKKEIQKFQRFIMYSLLLALIYLAFISLGLPDSLLGAGWPVMHEAFGVSISYMGIVTMIISGCTIFSSLMSDQVTRKFGANVVTVFSVFLTAAALMGLSFATAFWHLLFLAIPYGLGAGGVDAILNNYVALHFKPQHMSWLHCMWGVGASVSPYIMSFSLYHLTAGATVI
jgi:MFS family permease